MAALKILNEEPDRITLGKGGGNALGAVVGTLIFGVVACAGMGALLNDGGEINPVMIVIFLVIGLVILNSLAQALAMTRVVLDARQAIARRTDSIFFVPTRRQEISFNLIRDVQVTSAGASTAFALDTFPVWQTVLQGTDGSTLVVNERGTRAEMDALAQRVSAILNRPVRAEQTAAPAPDATMTYTPTVVMGSLFENLGAFVQSISEPAAGARAAQLSNARGAADDPFARASERLAADRVNAFESDAQAQARLSAGERAAAAPYRQASERLTTQQAAANQVSARLGDAAAIQSQEPMFGFSMPPLLTMPEMPSLLSTGPALNMPSMMPLGYTADAPRASETAMQEIKQVEVQVADQKDLAGLFRQARQLFNARNWSAAQDAYFRILDVNPADAMAQNDLGAVYFAQRKFEDAERAFRRAVALDPFTNISRYNLGLALEREGKRAAAREQFQVGAHNATRDDAAYFRDALRGSVRSEPFVSSVT